MSRPSVLPSPRARRAGRRRRRLRRGPRGRSRRRSGRPPRRATVPPEDCITSGSGSPAALRRLGEAGAGSGRAGGRGRRRSPSSSSARTRGSAAAPRARRRRGGRKRVLADRLGEPRLVRGVEVGEEQADRDRLGLASGRARRRSGAASSSLSCLDHAVGADPLGAPKRSSSGTSGGGFGPRRAGRAAGGPGGRSRAGPRSRRGDQRGAGAALLEQGVGADRHPVREALDVGGLGPGLRQDLLDRRHHALRLRPRASSAPSPCGSRSPSNRTASVKVPPTSTPSSTAQM